MFQKCFMVLILSAASFFFQATLAQQAAPNEDCYITAQPVERACAKFGNLNEWLPFRLPNAIANADVPGFCGGWIADVPTGSFHSVIPKTSPTTFEYNDGTTAAKVELLGNGIAQYSIKSPYVNSTDVRSLTNYGGETTPLNENGVTYGESVATSEFSLQAKFSNMAWQYRIDCSFGLSDVVQKHKQE